MPYERHAVCADCHREMTDEELKKREYYSYFNPDTTIGDQQGQRLLCQNCQRAHDSEQARTQDFQDPAPEDDKDAGDDVGSGAAQRDPRRRRY